MSHRGLPATRSDRRDPDALVTVGPAGEVRLLVSVRVDTDSAGEVGRHRPVVGVPVGIPAAVPAEHLAIVGADPVDVRPDLATLCTELTRSLAEDDLADAMAIVGTVAGCPTVLLRPDRTVLAAGEPSANGTARKVTSLQSRAWRWTANGPHVDRELAICAGTHRLGVLVFRKPIARARLAAPDWRIVHDLLALSLLNRDANHRAAVAEQQAALFACLSDDDPHRRHGDTGDHVRYRPAIVSPAPGDGPPTAELCARLHLHVDREPLLADGHLARVEDQIVCLYPEGIDTDPRRHAEAWQRVLDAAAPMRCRVVVGTPGESGADLRDSYQTTRWLADLQTTPMPGLGLDDVALVDELGVMAGTLGPGWGRRLGHFVRRVLGDLVENPRFGGEMVDTLHAYLVCRGSPTEAAKLLHLSPSSMKYRMRVIRETLGDRLDDHDSAFEIELALRLMKAFEAREAGRAPHRRRGHE